MENIKIKTIRDILIMEHALTNDVKTKQLRCYGHIGHVYGRRNKFLPGLHQEEKKVDEKIIFLRRFVFGK